MSVLAPILFDARYRYSCVTLCAEGHSCVTLCAEGHSYVTICAEVLISKLVTLRAEDTHY